MPGIDLTPNLSPKLLQRLQAEVGELCVANAALDILNQELIEQLTQIRAQYQHLADQMNREAQNGVEIGRELDELRGRLGELSSG